TLSANGARTKIGGGTTFTTAHLSGINSGLGFAPGQTLSGTILFEGTNPGGRNVEMNGTAGAFTVGATGVIQTATGLTANSQIGGSLYYGGAMALTNNGLISSQTNGITLTIQPASFTNAGVLEAANGGTLAVPAGYTQTAGTTRLNNGTLTASLSNIAQTVTISGGRLEGNGTVNANVSNAGTIAPGLLGAGHLTINGNVTLGSTSNIDIDIGGVTQGTQYDLLTQVGTVALTLQGTLTLHLANGFAPSGGQMFSILDSNQTLLGAFSNVVNGARLTTADGLGSFQVNYGPSSAFDPTDVVLNNFIAVPEPSTIASLALGGFVIFALRRKAICRRSRV
ncbi:MAG: PEP-CTERM sorting domain-containing protein, partial [Verrucomicrobiota bacterium]|nr:PEP-CTERM sorting domain-containing protein [Verrucomicrobiota bacterium]